MAGGETMASKAELDEMAEMIRRLPIATPMFQHIRRFLHKPIPVRLYLRSPR